MNKQQIERYARHLMLPEIGGAGQQKLLASSVLVVGAGGLGSPLLMYLAAAGVGRIGIVDDDAVDLSNLQRQVLHSTDAIGTPKTASAAAAIKAINPDVEVVTHERRLTAETAPALLKDHEIACDGSDNFATRYALNDACVRAGKTLVSAAIQRFDGQLSVFKPHAGPEHPCYRCLFPQPPAPGTVPSCAEAGVLGVLAGVMGSLQAVEVIKELLGIGESLSGRLLMYNALTAEFREFRIKRDPDCIACG